MSSLHQAIAFTTEDYKAPTDIVGEIINTGIEMINSLLGHIRGESNE